MAFAKNSVFMNIKNKITLYLLYNIYYLHIVHNYSRVTSHSATPYDITLDQYLTCTLSILLRHHLLKGGQKMINKTAFYVQNVGNETNTFKSIYH